MSGSSCWGMKNTHKSRYLQVTMSTMSAPGAGYKHFGTLLAHAVASLLRRHLVPRLLQDFAFVRNQDS